MKKIPFLFPAILALAMSACSKPEKPKPLATPPTESSTPKPKLAAKAPMPAKPTPAPEPAPAPAPKPETKSEIDKQVEAMYPFKEFIPLLDLVNNWETVPPRAFPKVITVNVPVDYKLVIDGKQIGSTPSAAGHRAKPLQHKGGRLLITNQPDSSTKAIVSVGDTNFKQLIQDTYNSKVTEYKERIIKARRVAKAALLARQSKGEKSVPDDAGDPRFAPVRAYLAAGKLESGLLEEAKQWIWLGKETHDGASYDAVLVNFEVDTIFGIFPNSMKCLLKDGEVVKWVDAETGELRS